jgi:hypothetical protein
MRWIRFTRNLSIIEARALASKEAARIGESVFVVCRPCVDRRRYTLWRIVSDAEYATYPRCPEGRKTVMDGMLSKRTIGGIVSGYRRRAE